MSTSTRITFIQGVACPSPPCTLPPLPMGTPLACVSYQLSYLHSVPWYLFQMVAQNKICTCGLLHLIFLFKAYVYIDSSVQYMNISFVNNYLHTCETCSELPSNTIPWFYTCIDFTEQAKHIIGFHINTSQSIN